MIIGNSKLLSFTNYCLTLIRRLLPEYSSKYSRKDFTQHQLATLVCLMKKYKPKYRDFIELLKHMDGYSYSDEVARLRSFRKIINYFLPTSMKEGLCILAQKNTSVMLNLNNKCLKGLTIIYR